MIRTTALAAALALVPAALAAQPPAPNPQAVMELMGRRSAEAQWQGRVLQIPGNPPRSAQVGLDCQMINARMRNCRVLFESIRGISQPILDQSNLLWMSYELPSRNETSVHILFDITQGTASIGRSDPTGVIILDPVAQPANNSGFTSFDTDRDGRLSTEEVRGIDRNNNGVVERAEFNASFRVATGGPERSYSAFDLNRDGSLTVAELQGAYRPQSIQDVRE